MFATPILVDATIELVIFSKTRPEETKPPTHIITAATACSGMLVRKSSGKSFASGIFPLAGP